MGNRSFIRLTAVFVAIFTLLSVASFGQEVTASGALSYTYPLNLPAGRNGMGPSLSLVYNSNAGNGMLGMGWSMGGLSIVTRDSSYPVNFADTGTGVDHFLLDGQKLILGGDGYYHTEKESYVRIQFLYPGTATAYWLVTLKNGTKMYYGYTDSDHSAANDGNITAVSKSPFALVWCLSRVEDVNGNYYVIEYSEDTTNTNGEYYPVRIIYTKPYVTADQNLINKVEFTYEPRNASDISIVYVPTKLIMHKQLRYINVSTGGVTQRIYELSYAPSPDTKRTLVQNIKVFGTDAAPTPGAGVFEAPIQEPSGSSLPVTSFDWSKSTAPLQPRVNWEAPFGPDPPDPPWGGWTTGVADFDGDGKDDVWQKDIYEPTKIAVFQIMFSDGTKFIVNDRCRNLFPDDTYLTGVADLNGDGKTDIWQVARSGGSAMYVWLAKKDANGFRFEDTTWPVSIGNTDGYMTGTADFNGDGKADFYQLYNTGAGYMWVYLTNSTGTGFEPAQQWGAGFGNTSWWNTGTADFNGDGKADVWQLLNDGSAGIVVWLANDTATGFLPPKLFGQNSAYSFLPKSQATTGTADFNGDGKADVWQKYKDSTTFHVWISSGDDLSIAKEWVSAWGGDTQYPFGIADFNGDGRTDFWQKDYADNYGHRFWVLFATGQDVIGQGCAGAPDIAPHCFTGSDVSDTYTGDFNGDGKADVWQKHFDGTNSYMWLSDNTFPDLLTKITLPTGGTVTTTYKPAPQVSGAIDPTRTDIANHKVASASTQNLVTSIEYNDGMNKPESKITTTYEYSNHMFYTGYTYEREDLGFEWIKKTDAASKMYTKTYYKQDKPYEGLVWRVETGNTNTTIDPYYKVSEYKYSSRTDNPTYPGIKFVYKTEEFAYDYNGEDQSTKITYYSKYCLDPANPAVSYYDTKGNLTRVDINCSHLSIQIIKKY